MLVLMPAGGGAIQVQHLDAQGGQCTLASAGGPVSVGGLDGNVTVSSQGGSISLTASDNVGTLLVRLGMVSTSVCRLFVPRQAHQGPAER